jgi:hypothetical protein
VTVFIVVYSDDSLEESAILEAFDSPDKAAAYVANQTGYITFENGETLDRYGHCFAYAGPGELHQIGYGTPEQCNEMIAAYNPGDNFTVIEMPVR